MKKLFYCVAALATVFFAGSCQRENLEPIANGGVTYTIALPEAVQTKGEDGYAEYDLYLEVYKTVDAAELETATLLFEKKEVISAQMNGKISVGLDLLNDQDYTILFWANKKDEAWFNTADLRKVEMVQSASNNEDRDAYCAMDQIVNHNGAIAKTVELKRPFAQINIATEVPQQIGYDVTPLSSMVKVTGIPVAYNVAKGEPVGNGVEVTYTVNTIPEGYISTEYKKVAMNYVLVPEGTVDVYYEINTANGTVKNTVANVPVRANYRTNIIGNLLTSNATYTVEVKPGFEADDFEESEFIVVDDVIGLQKAIDEAATGKTRIKINADIVGDVTVVQKPGVEIIIDGNNVDTRTSDSEITYTGSIKIHSNSNHYSNASLTLENIHFTPSAASVNCIEALENGSERYSTNITVNNCTFIATDAAVNTAVGVQIKSSKNTKVINCTATNMHSLLQAQSCDETVVVKDCTVEGKNGVAFKQVKAATVEGTTITALEYGIRFDGNTDNYGIVVKGNTVEAKQPFIVRKMTGKKNTITLEGINTLTTTEAEAEAKYQIVITNGSDDEEYVKPTGTYTLTGADSFKLFPAIPVAKIGNTEYTSIDDAIANWGHNTTLTLIANVTLNDVITLKSTEYHVLDLGTYKMTAASKKDAIQITAEGRTSASYALDIKADATNPGGITATSKAVVKTTGKSGVKDRPIIRFYNGVYNASNVISHSGSNGTNCPQFQFHGGVYNANLSANRALIQIYGGTFNGKFYISVDSSAYALISGGKFKYLDNLYGSALNSDKFTIGSSKGNFDRGVYVDDEGYIVVGGAVITEFGDKFAAKATNASKAGSYLPYSSAAEHGLYYTNAQMAIAKHGEANVVLK